MKDPESSTERSKNPFEWFATSLQDFLYFLVGVVTVGYGCVALVRWLVATWQLGSELKIFLALFGLLTIPAVFSSSFVAAGAFLLLP